MLLERNLALVARADASVHDRGHCPARRTDLARTQRLCPEVEELTQHECTLDGRLDMDQPVRIARVQPGEAISLCDSELSVDVVLRIDRRPDSNASGDATRLAVHKQRQGSVLVRDQGLVLLPLAPLLDCRDTARAGGGRATTAAVVSGWLYWSTRRNRRHWRTAGPLQRE